MKGEHTINLILISSKWVIPSSGVRSWYQILGSKLIHFFVFWSSKLSTLSCREAPSKSSQGSSYSFILHSFIIGVLHGGSTWLLIKDSFHSSIVLQDFSRSQDPPSYTLKINMVFNTCFVLWSSSILHLAFRSAILSLLSFEVVLCHSWQFEFAFHDSHVVKNEVF